MSSTYKEITLRLAALLTEAAADGDKFDRGQDAAGQRLRALFLDLAKECKIHRAEIQTIRKQRKASN